MNKTEAKQSRLCLLHRLKQQTLGTVKALQALQNLESEPLRAKDTLVTIYELVGTQSVLLSDRFGNRYVELPTGQILELSPLAVDFLKQQISQDSEDLIKKESKTSQRIDGWIDKIRKVPDFPKKGILFYDLMPVIQEPFWVRRIVGHLATRVRRLKPTKIAALESRGFFFGPQLADVLGIKFIPIRKKGKLPGKTIQYIYDKEYGQDTIEIQADTFSKKDSVVIVDDLLATGGTAQAASNLISPLVQEVNFAFVISLKDLKGKDLLGKDKHSIITLLDV